MIDSYRWWHGGRCPVGDQCEHLWPYPDPARNGVRIHVASTAESVPVAVTVLVEPSQVLDDVHR
jgi:hypothetical protein